MELEPETPLPTRTQAPDVKNVGFPSAVKNQKRKKKLIIGIVVLVFVLVLIIGGWLIFKGSGSEESEASPTPESFIEGVETASTPTPKPVSVDKKKLEIEVLNGTGIAGEAAYLVGQLKKLGFEKIDAANAQDQDYTETAVTFSSSIDEEVKDELLKRLGEIYKEVSAKTSRSLASDVRIITGLRKGVTPKPEATATAKPAVTATPTSTPTSAPATTPPATP